MKTDLAQKRAAFRDKQFSYRRLKGRIVERFGTQGAFAKAMGVTPQAISSRLLGKTNFSQGEIWYASILLGLTKEEVGELFFITVDEDNALILTGGGLAHGDED